MNKIQLKLALSITVAHCLSLGYASMNPNNDDYQEESSLGKSGLNNVNQSVENENYLHQSKLIMQPNYLLDNSELVTDNVLRFLNGKNLNKFGLTSKKALQKKNGYQDKLLKSCLYSIISCYGEKLSNLAARQSQAHDELKSFNIGGSSKSFRERMISEITDKIVKENRCAFLLKGSPLNLYVNQALLTPEGRYERLSAFILYQQNDDFRDFFNKKLFSKERDESYKASIAQHLFSQIAIYVPKQTQDRTEGDNQALQSFINDHKFQITHYLKEVYTNNNYIQFSPDLMTEQLAQDHHIVITDDQITDIANKEKLTALLDDRANHKVVLDIGNVFGKDGILKLTTTDIPEDLAHLIITNIKGNVSSIGDSFLSRAENLQSFDTAGLTGITSIGGSFLSRAENLQSFDTAGLTGVKFIGNAFLYNVKNLRSFDTTGLTGVTSIGDIFLSYAENLQSFDTAGLTGVKFIGDRFLSYAENLQSFDTAGLTGVTSIEERFLFRAENLQSFDTAGLTGVISIEDDFLYNVKNLRSFDTAGLTSLISVGNAFLSGAENLQSFDTAGLTGVKFIGDHFLFQAEKLENADLIRSFISKLER